jgi:Do/DeqQ family serine protease
MKKIALVLFVSISTSLATIFSYKYFFENTQEQLTKTIKPENSTLFKNVSLNTTPTKESINFISAAEKSINSVVHVKNTSIYSGPTTMNELFFGYRSEKKQIGTGSGVIISSDGYIVTNNHVIDEATEIEITLNNNKTYEAKLIGTDKETDIALLKVNTEEDLPYLTFGDSDDTQVGEWVLAVGNPFNLNSTVTAGIISAKSRDLEGQRSQSFLQTDAAVNPGNSGGALVNVNGDLIGINTAISSATGSYIGYSFAVPSNIARKVIEDIIEFGDVQNGILGVRGTELNNDTAKKFDTDITEGFFISEIEDNSGAKKANLKEGDIILKIDEIKISKFSDMKGYLKTKRPDDVVKLTINRNGEENTVNVKLSNYNNRVITFLEMELKNITSKKNTEKGVVITKINNEEYSYLGINVGDIILAINGYTVRNIKDIEKLKNNYNGRMLKIEIKNKKGKIENYIFR